jgi:hypothetical protein
LSNNTKKATGRILMKNRYVSYIYLIAALFLFANFLIFNKKINPRENESKATSGIFNQDNTFHRHRKKHEPSEEPDTNFTFEKYASFLDRISDTSKYIVLPLKEFRLTHNDRKIVIGLRHDVDIDLKHAFRFSEMEYEKGFRSTYFILPLTTLRISITRLCIPAR